MGLLDNLYLRKLAPGDLPFRRPAGVVQSATLTPAVRGIRIEIPRVARRLLPYALDLESGIDDRKGTTSIPRGAAPAPIYPGPVPGPIVPPALPPGPVLPPGTPPPTGAPTPPPAPVPAAPGYHRTFNLQITAETAGSLATQEIRATPTIGNPFRVTEIQITPLAGVTVGQYLDIVVAPDADLSDPGAFLGSSLFENPALLGVIPAPDNTRGISIPLQTLVLKHLGPIFAGGQQIKAVSYFTAPAAALPDIAITIVIEELLEASPIPPPRVPPTEPTPIPAPPYIATTAEPDYAPVPPLPSEPPGVIPTTPQPSYAIITVVPGYTDITTYIPTYDSTGHITAYIQDPTQAAQWQAIRDQYAALLASQPTAT